MADATQEGFVGPEGAAEEAEALTPPAAVGEEQVAAAASEDAPAGTEGAEGEDDEEVE